MAVIRVNFDRGAGHAGAQGRGAIGIANFGAAYVAFSSRGFQNGSLIRNASGITLTDLHIRLVSQGDSFDPMSSGGGANGFPNVVFMNNNTEIQLSGGNIANGADFWSAIPLSADFQGGMGRYTGRATPTQAAPPNPQPRPPAAAAPIGGNDSGNAQIVFNAPNFCFMGGNINFVQYDDGQVLRVNTSTETIIGSYLAIRGCQLVGSAPSPPGAFQLTDSYPFSVILGPGYYLNATLTQVYLYPDSSVPGFDCVVQGYLFWQESDTPCGGLGESRFLDELYEQLQFTPGLSTTFQFRTNLLAATSNLTNSASSPGIVVVTNTAN